MFFGPLLEPSNQILFRLKSQFELSTKSPKTCALTPEISGQMTGLFETPVRLSVWQLIFSRLMCKVQPAVVNEFPSIKTSSLEVGGKG